MSKSKKLSNPSSTGGVGVHFEGHVQASFVTLMLSGGHVPCLPCWPIVEVKLQGKIDGFDTDDFIVVVESENHKDRRKLLGQIKHSISITEGSPLFGEVIQAAWNDFNNLKVFAKGRDVIGLITGPLSKTDSEVVWLLNHARANPNDAARFFRNIATANFSSEVKRKKLDAFRHHLKIANGGSDLAEEDFHRFLKAFYLLGYDLGEEEGVVLSLINSHISQFRPESPRFVWSRILEFTNNRNHHAGCITRYDLPEELTNIFATEPIREIPDNLTRPQVTSIDWTQHSDATYLALAVLIGAWNEKSKCDIEAITQVLGIGYDGWLQKAREILICPDSPLSLKNGIWKVVNRVELLNLLGSRILDQNLNTFKSLAVSVLKEPDPAFELPVEERYAASIHGKELAHSPALRKGLAEGVAILGSNPLFLSNCSRGKAEVTGVLVIREILEEADWVVWGSLNDLLPTLAEAAPGEFLNAVEAALKMDPCPFDQLFAQEGNGITGENYLTGLLWALEGMAWDEIYLVRVCVVLGELASHDPGGQWANRPINSIATTLLPWFPQTLAPIEKRKIAVQTLCREWPDIGWKLIIQLLPNQFQTTVGAHKPTWRKTIPDDWEEGTTQKDHWDQVSFYAELAVSSADHDLEKLAELVEHFDDLPKPAFDQLLDVLASDAILELPENQRLPIWDHLTKFTTKHRKFAEANWALPDDLVASIEAIADKLAPTDPFNLYQHLFSDRDHDLFDEKGNWEEQKRRLDERRDKAIIEIFQKDGIDAVIQFARAVASPEQVGYALGSMSETSIEQALFPDYLDSEDKKLTLLSGGFVWRRHHDKGWIWSDQLERSTWSQEQIGRFLTCLPFKKETWERADQWLGDAQSEYWKRIGANAYQADEGLDIAIEKLIENGRPHAAIFCLDRMRHDKQAIDTKQCVRALLAGVSSEEPSHSMDQYRITELIKLLQEDTTVSEDDIFKIEWAYLPLLNRNRKAAPKHLERRLASNPEFFCEVIRLIYRSNKKDEPGKEPTEKSKAVATNAWHLLREWNTLPGTLEGGRFDKENFSDWIQKVKTICNETGHLEVALITIGGILIYSPADPDGLWIHKTIAETLNDRDFEDMRRGYFTGVFNSRGVRKVDPTGKPERELAEQYREKAEVIENAGYHRFAVTLRGLGDEYDREADRIIEEYKS